jgi:peptide/nickel transport system substrate-binding protein
VYTDTFSGYIVSNVFDTLIAYDEKLEPQPWLAERYEIAPDNVTYTFYLRKGIKFHDGTEMDAEAVKFSVDRVRDFPSGPSASEAKEIVDTQAVEKYTFKMVLKEPNAPFLVNMAGRIGMVVSPKAVREMGDEKFGLNPVGTGPFKFGEWQNDNYVRVNKNPDYWVMGADGKPVPYVDRVEMRVITESSSRLTALQAGDVHFMLAISDPDLNIIKRDSNIVWQQQPGLGWSSFLLTVTKPPFDNKSLRQAVSYAIDRKEIIDTIYEGNREVGNGPIPPPHAWALDPSYRPYPERADLNKAKAALAAGGRPNGFEFTMWAASGDSITQRLMELMAAQLAKAGITMKIEFADFNGVVIPKARAQEPGAFGISFSCGVDPDPCVDRRFRTGSSFNYMGYTNPKVDELILAARRTNNREERAKLYKDVVPLIMDDAPAVIFAYSVSRFVGQKKVQGWKVGTTTDPGFAMYWLNQ